MMSIGDHKNSKRAEKQQTAQMYAFGAGAAAQLALNRGELVASLAGVAAAQYAVHPDKAFKQLPPLDNDTLMAAGLGLLGGIVARRFL